MATPQQRVVEKATSQVGYVASAGKHTKYAQELDRTDVYNGAKDGYDWCDVFADWNYITCFGKDTAVKMINQPLRGCGAGCSFSASYYRAANQWSSTPSVGAQIFFGNKGDEYHTGIVVGFDGTYVHTVEGNTGYGQGYSSGAVLRRTYRRNDSAITGYGVPKWSLAGGAEVATEQTNTYKATGKLEVDGYLGVQSITFWQETMGTPVDGNISGQYAGNRAYIPNLVAVVFDNDADGSLLVKAIQRKVGADVDGIIGPQTVRCIQAWLNKHGYDLVVDGVLGPITAKAIQQSLNDGLWG